MRRKVTVFFFLVLFLLLMVVVLWFVRIVSRYGFLQFPNSISEMCKSLSKPFKERGTDGLYRKYAEQDKEATLNNRGAGHFQCYCQRETKSLTKLLALEDPFCNEYRDFKIFSGLSGGLAGLTVGLNLVLKNIIISWISNIGYFYKS